MPSDTVTPCSPVSSHETVNLLELKRLVFTPDKPEDPLRHTPARWRPVTVNWKFKTCENPETDTGIVVVAPGAMVALPAEKLTATTCAG